MKGVVDSLDNYAYEVHQYFDSNSSGTSSTCESATVGADRLKTFTGWLRSNNKKGFLGEFGIANNETCLRALDNMLSYIQDNGDVWLGWTYWAVGPWWGNYMFSVEPQGDIDRPQMAVLEKYSGESPTSASQTSLQGGHVQLLFPNPVTSSSHITFSIPETSRVELYVLNAVGSRIACLIDDLYGPGSHQVIWNADARLNPGVYFLFLKAGTSYAPTVKKMVIL